MVATLGHPFPPRTAGRGAGATPRPAPSTHHDGAPRLAILGGGLTGAALAIHALRGASGPLAVDVVARAALAGLDAADGRLVAALRGAGGVDHRPFDAAVLCTGPGSAVRADPLVRALVEGGLARPDGIGTGIAVDRDSRVLDRAGAGRDGLRAFGPITRGSFGEMTGQPDIVRHIARTVPGLLAALEGTRLAA